MTDVTDLEFVLFALPWLAVLAAGLGSGVMGEHRCRKEHARRQAAYLSACEQAKREGTRPPFPPNVVRWGP